MKNGVLFFNQETRRYDIRFDFDDCYGGLHCGDCLEVLINGEWKFTRIEMNEKWYLVGIKMDNLNGIHARI